MCKTPTALTRSMSFIVPIRTLGCAIETCAARHLNFVGHIWDNVLGLIVSRETVPILYHPPRTCPGFRHTGHTGLPRRKRGTIYCPGPRRDVSRSFRFALSLRCSRIHPGALLKTHRPQIRSKHRAQACGPSPTTRDGISQYISPILASIPTSMAAASGCPRKTALTSPHEPCESER